MTVRKYEILPKAGAQLVGSLLPWVEVAVALAVFLGILLPWSALLAAGLLGSFIAAVSFNILRGNRNISCGCFGSQNDSYLTWSIVSRNLLLVVVALLTIGSTRVDPSLAFASTIPLIVQLPIEESVATVGGAGALLGLWWFWSLLSRFWSPPKEEYPANT